MKALCFSTFGTDYTDFDLLLDIVSSIPADIAGIDYWLVDDGKEAAQQICSQASGSLSRFYSTLHSTAKPTELTSLMGSEAWGNSLAIYKRNFEVYRRINAHSITLHTNQRDVPECEAEQLRESCVANILYLDALAKEQGVHFQIENVGIRKLGKQLFDQEQFVRLFDRLPDSVACLIDTGHAMLNGWDLERLIMELGDRIRGFHLNSNDGPEKPLDTHRPLFTEEHYYSADRWRSLLRLMEKYSPNAEWILEYHSGTHINPGTMKEEIGMILSCLG